MPKVELDDLALRHGVAKRGTKAEVVDRLLGDLLDQASALGPSAPGVLDAAPAADVKQRRQRRTSRKATASADPLPEPAPAATAAAPPTEAPARRARRTSRRVSAVVEESAPAAPATTTAALGPAEAAPDAPVTPAKRARRQSRKTAAIEPEPAAVAAVEEAVAPKQRARRSSRKSAAMDPADGAAAPAPAPARQRSRGRSATVSAADGADVAMSESALGRQSKAWLQQAVAERGVYDPALHTTKAALVAALLGASTTARPEAPTTPLATGEGLVLGEEEASVNEEPYLDATPAFGASYEEVISQVRGGAGLEDEPAISGDAFGPAAAGAMASAAELLRVGAEVDDAASVRAAAEAERETLQALSARAASRDEARLAAEEEGAGGFAGEGAAAALYRTAPDLEDIAAALAEGGGAGGALAEEEAEDTALGVFDHLAFHFEADVDAVAQAAPVAAPGLEDIAAALAEGGGSFDASAAEDEAEDAALGVFDHLAFDFEADVDAAAQAAPVAAPDLEDIAAALAEGGGAFDASAAEDEAEDAALGVFDHLAFDFEADVDAAAQAAPVAAPELEDIAAALAEGGGSFDASAAEDEAEDAALGVFDHLAFDFEADVDAAAQAAPVAAPDLEDIAAALAEGGGAFDASAAEDEAEDAALGVFDHLAFDFEADLDAAAKEAEVEAAPDAGEAALAAAATAAEADAALLLRSASPLLVQDGAALVDEEPDRALRAFDHIAFDFDLQRASAAQFARAAAEPPLPTPGAAAALAEAAPIVLQDEAPDVALASFDHARFAPPRAAAEAEAPAAVATPRSADLGAPVGGAQRQQQQADVLVQFGEWLKEVVAAFEEWQRSLSK